MWVVKILSGANSGKILPLKAGINLVGRQSDCYISLQSFGVSKTHAEIQITENKAFISDLNSRNGSYVNGVRVKTQKLKTNDKIQIHDQMIEVIEVDEFALLNNKISIASSQNSIRARGSQLNSNPHLSHSSSSGAYGSAALQIGMSEQAYYNQNEPMQSHASNPHNFNSDPSQRIDNQRGQPSSQSLQPRGGLVQQIQQVISNYLENVVLPGVYKLTEVFELKWVMFGFILTFVFLVTALSVIPMSQITKQNIQKESQRRALTIAKNLALMNRSFVIEKREISLTTQMAEQESGVTEALIVNASKGIIMAPASKAGSHNQEPFVLKAIKNKDEFMEQITDNQIGASIPINTFDPQLGMAVPKAFAIVFYSVDDSSVDFNRTLSLFIQILLLALVVGAFLFYFLWKLVQFPLKSLNRQMNQILKQGEGELIVSFKDADLQDLISNLNTSLARMDQNSGHDAGVVYSETSTRENEAQSLIEMMGWPALAISAVDERIIGANPAFLQLQSTSTSLQHQELDVINDPALKESLKDLVKQLKIQGQQQVVHNLPSGGSETYVITGQKIMGRQEIAYFIFSILIQSDGGE